MKLSINVKTVSMLVKNFIKFYSISAELKKILETKKFKGVQLKSRLSSLSYRTDLCKAFVNNLTRKFSTDHEILNATTFHKNLTLWPTAKDNQKVACELLLCIEFYTVEQLRFFYSLLNFRNFLYVFHLFVADGFTNMNFEAEWYI